MAFSTRRLPRARARVEEHREWLVADHVFFHSCKEICHRLHEGAVVHQRCQRIYPDLTLSGLQGIVICPGFGQRGIEGKIIAAEYTRTHDIPTFGICLGMQMMVIEFARNVLGYKDATSAEFADSPLSLPSHSSSSLPSHYVIDMMEEQKNITEMGGTMRLGAYECELREGSKAAQAYNS